MLRRVRFIAIALFFVSWTAPARFCRARGSKPALSLSESPNLVRERGAWFYGQIEYPLSYISAGALLKALHQGTKP